MNFIFEKMKKILIILAIILTSCDNDIIERKYKLFYINGKTEVVIVKNYSNVISKPVLYNSCLYREKHNRNCIGQIRCGISYMVKISEKRISKVK
jgi:hypothetical protein